MALSTAEQAQADAFLEWIRHFDLPCKHLDDLRDGTILWELLNTITSTYRDPLRHGNWMTMYENLQLLCQRMQELDAELPVLDLQVIAKGVNDRELLKLCQVMLHVAVKHERFGEFGKLSEASRERIQEFAGSTLSTPTQPTRATRENEMLRVEHQRLVEKHEKLIARVEDLQKKKQELQEQLLQMDTVVAQANEMGRTDLMLRNEIDKLKEDLQRSEDRRQEVEILLESQTTTMEDLARKKKELETQVEQVADLKDQLDEYRHTTEKLQKAEGMIEKYKKKLEESAELRRQLKELEIQNMELEDSNKSFHDELGRQLAFKTLEDSYRTQITDLQAKNSEQLREIKEMEERIQNLTTEVDQLEHVKQFNADQIQELEERLQEAQHSVTQNKSQPEDMDLDGDQGSHSLEDSLKETNATELRMTNSRLERQLKSPLENSLGRSQKEIVLQHLLDDANRLKSYYEKKYLEESKERDMLQSDMARIRKGISDAMLEKNQHTLSLRLYILDLEKEAKALREEEGALQTKLTKTESSRALAATQQEMEQRVRKLEEQTQEQLRTINKLLLEKDYFQSERIMQKDMMLKTEKMNSELKESLAALGSSSDEELRKSNTQLQLRIAEHKGHLSDLESKLAKAKEFIKQQDKMLKEAHQNHDNNYDEAIVSLKQELRQRDEDNEKLKRQIHETRLQARREQQLIISAWYDVARRTHKHLSTSKVYPNSWLAQQRRTLDNQLRRQ